MVNSTDCLFFMIFCEMILPNGPPINTYIIILIMNDNNDSNE